MRPKQTMNKSMLASIVAIKCGILKKEAEKIISETFSVIKSEVRQGSKVRINGFGVFDTVWRKKKVGMDMNRHRRVEIPAHRIPVFRSSKVFRRKISNNLKS